GLGQHFGNLISRAGGRQQENIYLSPFALGLAGQRRKLIKGLKGLDRSLALSAEQDAAHDWVDRLGALLGEVAYRRETLGDPRPGIKHRRGLLEWRIVDGHDVGAQ